MSRFFCAGFSRLVLALALASPLAGLAAAQDATSPAQQPASPSSQPQTQSEPDQGNGNTKNGSKPQAGNGEQSDADQSKPAESKTETKITRQQAEQLFRDVDTILDFASKDSSLPIKHEVKRRLASREEVVTYLKKNMAEDKDVKRLRRTELVLKKFGLLPKNFDLQSFLVSLLEEQVAGYYDSKTKTVNLLDWVVPDLQRPVLAHELTHALQDQSFGLDKWLKKGDEDLDTKKNLTPADITEDENSEARQAIVEGQAMVVLLDYMLAPLHRNVADSPDIVDTLNSDMATGSADAVQYKNAPIFLKESLTFPYRYGIEFEAEVLRARGKEQAFVTPFQNPPQTSREIMEPQTYIQGEHIPQLPLPDFKRIFKDYERFDVGAIGEFDVDVLAEQYAGEDAAKHVYPNWRGGYYYSVHHKHDSNSPLGLLFVSRWSSDRAAAQFAAIYARGMQQRYKNVAAAQSSDLPADLKSLRTLGGDHTWNTEEGAVVIDVKGDTVLVTESLDAKITDQFRAQVLGSPAEKH
ncbi:MAG TPA: hypothetical protein VF133_20525 [Terriglobales bacterium]